MCAILASVLSGLSGVLLEYKLKFNDNSNATNNVNNNSVWNMNFQLSVISLIFGCLNVLCSKTAWESVVENGFFYKYTYLTWIVVLLGSSGGILVALLLFYLDNIIKGFATSFAIISTALTSYFILHDTSRSISVSFIIGIAIVILAALCTTIKILPLSVIPAVISRMVVRVQDTKNQILCSINYYVESCVK